MKGWEFALSLVAGATVLVLLGRYLFGLWGILAVPVIVIAWMAIRARPTSATAATVTAWIVSSVSVVLALILMAVAWNAEGLGGIPFGVGGIAMLFVAAAAAVVAAYKRPPPQSNAPE